MHKPRVEWTLNQWLIDLENRHPKEIQLGLTRITSVAKRLNVLTPDCKVITVGGTNGKGSTVSALEALYHHAGYQIGVYTSPHLLTFNERIRVNLNPITDAELCAAFMRLDEARGDTFLTYFEMTTLAALLHFKDYPLDLIILEVGLGGRLDATNIMNPDVSIITTIDFDHQDFLGNTLDAIGFEKAGILRETKPFIYADLNPPESILQVAKHLNVSSYCYGIDYVIHEHAHDWELQYASHSLSHIPKPRIQLKSAAAAMMACIVLKDDLPITDQQYREAMDKVFIPGRLQLVQQGHVAVMYDVAHNPQGARLLADTLKKMRWKGHIFAVFSALKDKDILGLILPLRDCVHRWFPAQLDNKRASDADLLLSKFRDAEINVEICYTTPLSAFDSALNQAEEGDLIIIYGSFYTVSHIMTAQHKILELKEIE